MGASPAWATTTTRSWRRGSSSSRSATRLTSWRPHRPKRSSRSRISGSRATGSVPLLTQPTSSGGSTAGTTARSEDGPPWTTTDHGPWFDHRGRGCRQRGPLRRDAPDASPGVIGAHRSVSVKTFTRNLCALLAFGRLNTAGPRRTPDSTLRVPLCRTPSHSSRLLVVPITQRLAQAPRNSTRDGVLDGGQDVGRETGGLCDRALQVDPIARRELLGRHRQEAREVGRTERDGRPW